MRITESRLRSLIREFLSSFASRAGAQSNAYTDFTRQELSLPVVGSREHEADKEMEDETCPTCHGKGIVMVPANTSKTNRGNMRITESQLRRVVKRLIREQSAGRLTDTSEMEIDDETCAICDAPLVPGDDDLCAKCQAEHGDDFEDEDEDEEFPGGERTECPECGAVLDPDAIEDNSGGLCDACSDAWEEGETNAMNGKFW